MKRLLIVALLLPFAASALADDAAQVAPADAGVFIELRDPVQLRAAFADDPLLEAIEAKLPAQRNPDAWRFIQLALNMSGEEIINTYFARQIVLIAERPGDGEPGAIFTRIDPADARKLIDGLALRKTAQINDFALYEPEDRGSRIAFGGEWMVIADQWHEDFLLDVLNDVGGEHQLADDAAYKEWTARLPAERRGTAFVRGPDGVHALGLTGGEAGVTLHYAGRSQRFDPMLAHVGAARTLATSPAPADALLVAAVNFENPDPKHRAFVERVIAPFTYEQLRDTVGVPLVVWMSKHDRDGTAVPVFGAALHVERAEGADVLDHAIGNVLLLANMATLAWNMPPLVAEPRDADGRSYHIVPVGKALPDRTRIAALKDADVTYGRLGDWYVATTSERAFLAAQPPTVAQPVNDSRRPVAMLRLRGREMAAHLRAVHATLPPQAQRNENLDHILAVVPWLERYATLSLHLETDSDGVVYATLDAAR